MDSHTTTSTSSSLRCRTSHHPKQASHFHPHNSKTIKPATAKFPADPNLTPNFTAPLLGFAVVIEVATAPKLVVAPAEFTKILLVTRLITVPEVVNPTGTPVDVKVVFEAGLTVLVIIEEWVPVVEEDAEV